jgi:DNA repair exonuclease SbcCD ATPase subunit
MTTIEKRIVAALASDATSADVATMIAEVDVALPTAIDSAERERIKAYDPTVDAQKARQSLADAEFARDRLQAALAALQRQLQELQAQEYSAQWHGNYAQIEAKCDELAAELREIYPAVQSKLADLLSRIEGCDAEIGRINGSAPAGVALRLHKVELVARNLERFTRDEPSITNELRLPDWDQPSKLAWPPPQTPLAVLVLQGMAAAVDHPGATWWQR